MMMVHGSSEGGEASTMLWNSECRCLGDGGLLTETMKEGGGDVEGKPPWV